jgi:hypothetical protein
MNFHRTMLALLIAIMLCSPADSSASAGLVGTHTSQQFRSYWYPNGAEISRFALRQARYGEIHNGDAVLIFVTESMNPKLQVKADHPGPGDIPILKLNSVRKFFTGIYPYSTLTSTFAPVDAQTYPLPLKITATTQEWCGNVYLQMNLRENQWRVESHSYFEKEADQAFQLPAAMPEDALWTTIRIDPSSLPQGDFSLIPGALYTRFLHRPVQPSQVFGQLSANDGKSLEGKPLVCYTVIFRDEGRTLKILFERDFPYRIQRWEDTHRVLNGDTLTTTAVRTHTILNDYWNHHSNRDRRLLTQLGLKDGDQR